MKLLAFDSSSEWACVALVEDGKVTKEDAKQLGMKHSEILLPMAEELLRSCGLSFCDVDAYGVSTGPGSFTGVRIGAATVKGLAFGRSLPIGAVSALEALACNLSEECGVIIAAMDARRGEVYTATFLSNGEGTLTRLTPDRAIPLTELCTELLSEKRPIYIVGDGYTVTHRALAEQGIEAQQTPPELQHASAGSVGRLAYRRILEGNAVTDASLAPSYLRVAQAERERLEREAACR